MTPEVAQYKHCLQQARALGETGDCSVRALCMASLSLEKPLSYREAWTHLSIFGRRPHRDGPPEWSPVVEWAYPMAGLELKKITKKVLKEARTSYSFGKMEGLGDDWYILVFCDHVCAAKGNQIFDWCRGSRKRLVDVYLVG